MKKYAWPISFRALFVIAHLIILTALSKELFEIKGFGTFTIEGVNEWGSRFLKYTTVATIAAAAVLPVRFSFYLSGLVMGGLTMIGLKDGRDAIELAKMMDTTNENADISHFVEVLPSGDLLIWGLAISAFMVTVGTLARIVTSLRSLIKKAPQDQPAEL